MLICKVANTIDELDELIDDFAYFPRSTHFSLSLLLALCVTLCCVYTGRSSYRLAAKPQGALHGTKLMFRALEDGPAVSSGNLTGLEPDLNMGAHARL